MINCGVGAHTDVEWISAAEAVLPPTIATIEHVFHIDTNDPLLPGFVLR